MSSPTKKTDLTFPNKLNSVLSCTSDLSPVTGLALNLNSLSTSPILTPIRRISWSSCSPCSVVPKMFGTSLCSNLPVGSSESPMVQEGVLRELEVCARHGKKLKLSQRILSSQNKENVSQKDIRKYFPSMKHSPAKAIKIAPQVSDSDFAQGSSQESGYLEKSFHSNDSQSSMASVHSSLLSDNDMDDDSFFSVDHFLEDDEKSVGLSSSMTKLLTNPLSDPVFRGQCQTFGAEYSSCRTKKGLLMASHSRISSTAEENGENLDPQLMGLCSPLGGKLIELNGKPSKAAFKRPEPMEQITPTYSKRRKSSPNVGVLSSLLPSEKTVLVRSYSETSATLAMKALQKSQSNPNLIGDFSKPYALPLISGRHPDLMTISPETLAKLLRGEYSMNVSDFKIIDCRFPYEFEGGHICGAQNIYNRKDIVSNLLSGVRIDEDSEMQHHHLMVFHCEFSSERAPRLLRFLRNMDREMNTDSYPRLHHPETYVLEGGYKAFYEKHPELCEPQAYKPMLHRDHMNEMREFREKSKSWSGNKHFRAKIRSNLNF